MLELGGGPGEVSPQRLPGHHLLSPDDPLLLPDLETVDAGQSLETRFIQKFFFHEILTFFIRKAFRIAVK